VVLLKSYRKEIFRPACNPSFQSLHCIAHLDQDISEVLPYLNASLGGFEYLKDPPALSLKLHGKLITLHPQKIAINALKDGMEAEKIIEWLKGEINEAWDKRTEIEPRYEGSPKPDLLEILRILPKTNCQECGQPTCMVFSSLVARGVKGADDCPSLDNKGRERLLEYLKQFPFYES
jgi:ArsR family metal-binding transcriptional regulator